jgi:hypothetical protein
MRQATTFPRRGRRSAGPAPLAGLAGLLLVAALALLPAAAAQAVGQVGDAAGDFSLFDTQGQTHELGQYAGKVLFLYMVGYA